MTPTQIFTDARKAVAALSGAAATAAAADLLTGSTEKWVSGVLAAVTTFLVYMVPNGKRAAEAPAPAPAPAPEHAPKPRPKPKPAPTEPKQP